MPSGGSQPLQRLEQAQGGQHRRALPVGRVVGQELCDSRVELLLLFRGEQGFRHGARFVGPPKRESNEKARLSRHRISPHNARVSGPEDKRQSPRMALVLRVDYPSKQALADATENISFGGVFVQTTQKFPLGEQVQLSLSFPGLLEAIEITGRVSWVRAEQSGGRGPGVGFAVEAVEHRKRLERLLSVEPSVTEQLPTGTAPATGFRVLIVEDNPHIIEMYSYVLKKLAANDLKGKVPLEVHFAADGHARARPAARPRPSTW